MKTTFYFRPAKGPVLAHAALGDKPASNTPFVMVWEIHPVMVLA
jgi:hypothetical protein